MIASLFTSFIATKLGKFLPSWAWEIVIIALLIGAGALAHHVAVVHHDNSVRAIQKAADQKIIDGLKAQLTAISTARDTQKVVTKTNIETVTKVIHDAEGKAEIVEKAPPAPQCKTKPEILGADL